MSGVRYYGGPMTDGRISNSAAGVVGVFSDGVESLRLDPASPRFLLDFPSRIDPHCSW
jgi:hypothetical protein